MHSDVQHGNGFRAAEPIAMLQPSQVVGMGKRSWLRPASILAAILGCGPEGLTRAVYTKVTPKKGRRCYRSATPEKDQGCSGRMPVAETSSTRGVAWIGATTT